MNKERIPTVREKSGLSSVIKTQKKSIKWTGPAFRETICLPSVRSEGGNVERAKAHKGGRSAKRVWSRKSNPTCDSLNALMAGQ